MDQSGVTKASRETILMMAGGKISAKKETLRYDEVVLFRSSYVPRHTCVGFSCELVKVKGFTATNELTHGERHTTT